MITELVGMPGSGKSTYATGLIEENKNRSIVSLNGRLERFFGSLSFSLKNLPLVILLFSWLLRKHSGGWRLLKHKTFMFSVALAKENKARNTSIVDDGLLQFVFSISDYPLSSVEVSKIVSRLDLRDREVIFIDCADEVSALRMKNRKRIPRSQFGEKYVQTFFGAMRANSPLLIGELEKKFIVTKVTT